MFPYPEFDKIQKHVINKWRVKMGNKRFKRRIKENPCLPLAWTGKMQRECLMRLFNKFKPDPAEISTIKNRK